MTYVWDSATQDTEAVHNAVRTAGSEVVARVRFADVCCHGTCEIGIVRVGGSKIEVVDPRGVGGDVLVVELWRQLNGAAYLIRSVEGRQKKTKRVYNYRTSIVQSSEHRVDRTMSPEYWKHQPRIYSTPERSALVCGST